MLSKIYFKYWHPKTNFGNTYLADYLFLSNVIMCVNKYINLQNKLYIHMCVCVCVWRVQMQKPL